MCVCLSRRTSRGCLGRTSKLSVAQPLLPRVPLRARLLLVFDLPTAGHPLLLLLPSQPPRFQDSAASSLDQDRGWQRSWSGTSWQSGMVLFRNEELLELPNAVYTCLGSCFPIVTREHSRLLVQLERSVNVLCAEKGVGLKLALFSLQIFGERYEVNGSGTCRSRPWRP
jgi:hypothetical protein